MLTLWNWIKRTVPRSEAFFKAAPSVEQPMPMPAKLCSVWPAKCLKHTTISLKRVAISSQTQTNRTLHCLAVSEPQFQNKLCEYIYSCGAHVAHEDVHLSSSYIYTHVIPAGKNSTVRGGNASRGCNCDLHSFMDGQSTKMLQILKELTRSYKKGLIFEASTTSS